MPANSLLHVLNACLVAMATAWPCAALGQRGDAEGTLASVKDCELRYRIHRGDRGGDAPVAVIAHGFLRNGAFMSGWADAIARSGTTAVTVDLCASAAANGRHADNGTDLVALRRALGIDAVIYVGVSAGGLAALIAAAQDAEATRGLLLLDPTNAGGQARSAAARVQAPVAALITKPQLCNAWRNIDPALQTLRDATIVRIDNASHCNFEWPTDNFCRVACLSPADAARDTRSESRIRQIGLAFVAAVASGNAAALGEWKAGIGEALK